MARCRNLIQWLDKPGTAHFIRRGNSFLMFRFTVEGAALRVVGAMGPALFAGLEADFGLRA